MSGFVIKETAKRIRDIRKQKGISAEDLAEKIGMNRATYYRYESGDLKNLKFDKIQKIADALDVYPVDLVVWEEEKPALNEDELDDELIRYQISTVRTLTIYRDYGIIVIVPY